MITLACQFVTAWTPDTGKALKWIHRIAAYSLAAFFPVLLYILINSAYISLFAQVIAAIAILMMSVFWGLFIFVKSSRAKYLIYQSLYLVSFHVSILAATYI